MTKHRITRSGAGVLAAAGITLLFAVGCGKSDGGDLEVASLGATTTAPAASGDETDTANTEDAMLEFAKCMREHGVDMPDPKPAGDGGATFQVGSEDEPMDKATVDAAQEACQSILDKVRSDMPPMDPAKVEEEKQRMLDFAQCMREHGIDMPDPKINSTNGGIQVEMGGEGSIDPSSPAFKEANKTCAAAVGLPAPGEGGAGVAVAPAGGASS